MSGKNNFIYPVTYDVLVCGAGHAGIEAALAATRLGCRVAILTQNLDTVAQMSCNPAIGGLAKGHLVREIDALGGVMGANTDATGIQFRMLNSSKGASVRAPRAQCDKKAYQFRMKWILENTWGLEMHQGNVKSLQLGNSGVTGVETTLGVVYKAKSIVVSAGTFMRGLLHVGLNNQPGGRMGDSTSTISDTLQDIGFEVNRFKTGTPCRLNGRSIRIDRCEQQLGDDPPPQFGYMTGIAGNDNGLFTLNCWNPKRFHVEQVACLTTYTNSRTHDIIRANLDKSPMFCGAIIGVGPRCCPSIEDKVVRFAEKERHQIFLEPEGLHSNEYYVNGISTSLPFDVQYEFVRSIQGLENAEIIRPGYAVEYDYCPPTQLHATLETKRIPGLYFAGQINGTSGYEEAAGQGLVAGANAGLKVLGREPFFVARSEGYLGVMIDDLVTKGVVEPYRLFTSRAEYRLQLRQDNADLRLLNKAIETGLVDDQRISVTREKQSRLNCLKKFVHASRYHELRLDAWLKRPENNWNNLPQEIRVKYSDELWGIAECDLKYEGYVRRQDEQIAKSRRMDDHPIPACIDYETLSGLKKEAIQQLLRIKPQTVGQASRIQGVTPADLSILTVAMKRQKNTADTMNTGAEMKL